MGARYDKIGIGYDHTRRADPYLCDRIAHLMGPATQYQYLDVGCGTGNYTIALRAKGYDFTGMDPSAEMLAQARQKSNKVIWVSGQAEDMPFIDGSFDGILAMLTLHHWQDLDAGLEECARVLERGKRMVIFTATPQQMEGYWLGHYFPQMLQDSMQIMPTLERMQSAASKAELQLITTEKYCIQPHLQDHFLYSSKYNPERYLDPQIRSGISSFAAFSNAQEVKSGLAKMQADITQNKIQSIIDSYQNEDGDYLFIQLQK
jgi:ubiquinone/menaquinone biosynthesis C-methylase UbiE